eukprot:scpid111969/ scgid29203/ 
MNPFLAIIRKSDEMDLEGFCISALRMLPGHSSSNSQYGNRTIISSGPSLVICLSVYARVAHSFIRRSQFRQQGIRGSGSIVLVFHLSVSVSLPTKETTNNLNHCLPHHGLSSV